MNTTPALPHSGTQHSACNVWRPLAAPFLLPALLLLSLLTLAKSMLQKSRPAAEHRHPCLCGQRASGLLCPWMHAGCPLAAQPGWLCSPIAAPFLLAALLLLALLPLANADAPDDPVFAGQTITINGIEYTFDSAAESESTVNNVTFTVHTDNYVSAGGTVSLQGRLASPQPILAFVNGDEGGAFSGIWSGGAYFVDSYFPRISGPGYTLQGSNAVTRVSGGDFQEFTADWQLQVARRKDTYSIDGAAGTLATETDSSGVGRFSGTRSGAALSGTVLNGNLYLDAAILSSSFGGPATYELFGTTYSVKRIEYTILQVDGNSLLRATEKYEDPHGGDLSVHHLDVLSSPPVTSGTFSGNDPALGSFGGSFVSPEFLVFDQNRSAPSFADSNLWVNSTLVPWVSSQIVNAAGDVTDVYAGTMDGNAVHITVSGNVPAFKWNENAVNPIVIVEVLNGAVPVYGTPASGSYVKSAPCYFDVPGWYIGAADSIRSTPLCLPSTPNLWVNGTRYLFRGGVDDAAGNSVDTYLNPSAGQLVLTGNWAGTTHHSASVRVSYQSAAYTGTYDSGRPPADVFDIRDGSNVPIPVADSGSTPDAFWVDGNLYRVSENSDFEFADAHGHSLIATLQGEGTALALSGTDALSAFSGSWTKGTALFHCSRSGGQTIPACLARWDGALMLDAANAPEGLPPAIKVQGMICPYIGTSSEDESPEVQEAYYGHASPGSTGNLLLRIRLDDGTVTLVDYAAQTSRTGTYSTATHLFQTALDQLPAPIYGTDPLHNFERWLWHSPQSGRPATVLVAGQAWGTPMRMRRAITMRDTMKARKSPSPMAATAMASSP